MAEQPEQRSFEITYQIYGEDRYEFLSQHAMLVGRIFHRENKAGEYFIKTHERRVAESMELYMKKQRIQYTVVDKYDPKDPQDNPRTTSKPWSLAVRFMSNWIHGRL